MPINYEKINPEFNIAVRNLLDACSAAGIEMRPIYAVRSPWEQARLWRQSRSSEEIQAKLKDLRASGGAWIADCIESVGPQSGRESTNALPGYSWHQWGEAVDCAWIVNKKAEWSTDKLFNGVNGYKLYAEIAEGMGLTHGLRPGHKNEWDWVHVQFRPASVNAYYKTDEVIQEMKVRYGSDPFQSG